MLIKQILKTITKDIQTSLIIIMHKTNKITIRLLKLKKIIIDIIIIIDNKKIKIKSKITYINYN